MPKITIKKPLVMAVCAASAITLSVQASVALAQGAAGLEEVIVTAQKREQSIQDVPISVSTFSSESLQEASIDTLSDVLDFAPNVRRSSGPSGNSDAFFFFRGIGQTDNNINVDPGVGVYIDEVYLGRLQGASFNLFDAQRVEILRGPQGTFFGRNTMGGAVSMITKDPSEEFSAEARVTAGDRDRIDTAGAVSGPLTDTLGARLSLFTRNQDGWTTSTVNNQDYGDTNEEGGRLKMVYEPSEALRISLGGDYAKDNGTIIGTSLIGFNPEANTVPAGAFSPPGFPVQIPPFDLVGNSPILIPFPLDMGDDLDTRPFDDKIYNDGTPDSMTKRRGTNLTAAWDTDLMLVKSITAYRKVNQETGSDLDGTGYHFYNADFGTDSKQFTQELQFIGDSLEGKLNWTGGLYFMNENIAGSTDICVGVTPPPVGPPNPFPPFWIPDPANTQQNDGRCMLFQSLVGIKVESYAAFGQLEYNITDKLIGIVGARYTDESKNQNFRTYSNNTDEVVGWLPPPILPFPGTIDVGVGPENPPYKYHKSWDEFSPKLGFTYAFNDDLTTYFTWSNGFKSGGFAGRATPGKEVESFDPETLESYEGGFKSEWFDNRLRWNTAVFFSNYEDVQQLVLDAVIQGNPQFITINGGTNEIYGMETELSAVPLPELELGLGVGYLHTKWTDLPTGSVIEKDDELPNAPEWSVNASAQYTYEMGAMGALMARGDFAYNDSFSFQPNNNPLDIQDSYQIFNVRFAWISPDRNWNVAVYGLNVSDEEYYMTLSDQRGDLGVATGVSAPPREWGMEVNYQY